MRLAIALLIAALVLAGHVVPPAGGNCNDGLTKSTSTACDEAQRSGKLGNADLTGVGDNIKVVVEESFNLSASIQPKSYMAFLADLDFHVNATAARLLNLHPVLGRQQLRDAPATFFKITVTGDDDDRVDFFMRSDNLYISGFNNKYGTLFAFKIQGNQYRMPGSTLLSFGGGYNDFFGQEVGARGLTNVVINRNQALDDLKILANYQGGPDEALKLPSAFFVLTIAEAERFIPLRQAVFQRWNAKKARPIDDPVQDHRLLIDLATNWRTFSCAILSWYKHGQTENTWRSISEARDIRVFGVQTAQQALSMVNPILQPVPWKCTWTY